MKLVLNKNLWTTALAGAALLSLTACGGGGSSNGAAATPSGTESPGGVTQPVLVPVQGATLTAGAGYSLALTSDGKVQSWGNGMHGTVATPSTIAAVGATSWAAGLDASWAITATGDVLFWGYDANAQLTASAVTLSGLGHVAAMRACGSGNGALFYVLKTDGTVWAVPARGLSTTTQGFAVSGLGQVQALSSGGDASCSAMLAIAADGSVSQLHASNPAVMGGVPTQAQAVTVAGLNGVVQASCAAGNCLALTSGGAVMAWGSNDKGQLGDLTLDARSTPARVDLSAFAVSGAPPKVRQVLVTNGGAAYAVSTGGALYGWGQLDGWISAGSTGYAGTQPVRLLSDSSTTQQIVAAPVASGHTLVSFGDGSVWGWGTNSQLEVKSPASTALTTPAATGKSLN